MRPASSRATVSSLYFVFYRGEGGSYELAGWQFVKGEEEIVTRCPEETAKRVEGREYGSPEHITYFSQTTGLERGANVLLPAGYDPEKQYGVLYFQHGIFTWITPAVFSSQRAVIRSARGAVSPKSTP